MRSADGNRPFGGHASPDFNTIASRFKTLTPVNEDPPRQRSLTL